MAGRVSPASRRPKEYQQRAVEVWASAAFLFFQCSDWVNFVMFDATLSG